MFYILVEIYAMGTEWHIITDTDTSEQMAQYIRNNMEDLQDIQYEDDAYFSIKVCIGEYLTESWEGSIQKLLKIMEDINE